MVKLEFLLNGNALANFKMCDMLTFVETYDNADIIVHKENYCKFLLSDESGTDIWEVREVRK